MTKNIGKFFKNDLKYWKILQTKGKFGLRPQKQYIMTYCYRNSMEGALIQYTGQKTVSSITPAIQKRSLRGNYREEKKTHGVKSNRCRFMQF